MKAVKVGTVIDNGVDLSTPAPESAAPKGKGKAKAAPTPQPAKKSKAKTINGFYDEYASRAETEWRAI